MQANLHSSTKVLNAESTETVCTERKVVFPGSFDPFHEGHRNIVMRALSLFDQVIVGIGVNPDKQYMFSAEERLKRIKQEFRNNPRVSVEAYDGLTIDFAKKHQALYIIKGVRNATDFEYEQEQARWNKSNGQIETLLLFAEDGLEDVSSTNIRKKICQSQSPLPLEGLEETSNLQVND